MGRIFRTPQPFLFDGAYLDQATGFYKMGARYYDPFVGRWTQMDPVFGDRFNTSTLNRYLFAENTPTTLTDPSGYICWPYFAAAAFWLAVGLAATAVALFYQYRNPGAAQTWWHAAATAFALMATFWYLAWRPRC